MLNLQLLPFPLLQTERCILRQFISDDAQEIFRLRTNDEVLKHLDKEKMQSVQEAEIYIAKINEALESNDGISWAICLKKNNILVGIIGLWRMIKEHHRAEIGYSLHPDQWAKGIMNEAIKKVICFGFEKLKLHSIEANVNPSNISSIRLLERNGFVKEAHFKENYYFCGKFLDSAIYSLINYESNL